MKKKNLEIYIHIPFCVRKCYYCDFLSAPADESTRERYVEALLSEISGRAGEFAEYEVVSVFFGGGTPSVLEAKQIEAIVECLRAEYAFAKEYEMTIEVNPGTVDEEKLQAYRRAGINRLSIGLQSANDLELQRIGRIHNREQFLEAYRLATALGFTNINVDLMSTLPGQTLADYCDNLAFVTELIPAPKHISAYSLILEEGTALYDAVEAGQEEMPDEELDREMYAETKRFFRERGYQRYEISNYALPGYECRHNVGYWTGCEYVGFGIGAASLVEDKRFANRPDLKAYLQEPMNCRGEVEVLSREDRMEEFMFLGLRLIQGVSLAEFQEQFGVSAESVFGDVIKKNREDGLLVQTTDSEEDCRIALTERGLDVSNYVMAQFLLETTPSV